MRTVPGWARVAGLLAGYLGLLWFATAVSQLFRTPEGVSLWYAPAALTVVVVLLGGIRIVPLVVLARVALVVATGTSPLPWYSILAVAAMVTLVYAGAAALLGRIGLDLRLRRLRDVAWFLGLMAAVAPAVAAALSVGYRVALGVLPSSRYLVTVRDFWIGDAVAVVGLAPALLLLGGRLLRTDRLPTAPPSNGRTRRLRRPPLRVLGEAAVQVAVVLCVVLITAAGGPLAVNQLYPCLLPVIWIALRHGVATTATVVAGLSLVLTMLVRGHTADFGGVADVQSFLVVLAGTGLCVAARASEQRSAEHRLRRGYERERALSARLAEYAQGQRDFVGSASHELRTPLTSIIGYLEIVLDDDGPLTPLQRRSIESAYRGGRRLHELVNDLLLLNRVDTGNMVLQRAPVTVRALLDGVAETFSPLCARQQLRLVIDVEPGLPELVLDRSRFEQVLTNLVGNAVKFTPAGGEVRVEAVRDRATVVLRVCDTGMGISADELPHVYDRFYRSASSVKNATPGTGLGLTIARAIVEAHDGDIRLSSVPGHGTTVEVRLPASTTAAGAGTRTPPVPSARTGSGRAAVRAADAGR